MTQLTKPILIGALTLLWTGAASAGPIELTYVSIEVFDAGFGSTQTFTPPLCGAGPPPTCLQGSGDVDEAAGTYSLTLPFFSIVLDILADAVDDAQLDTTGWGQDGTFAAGVGGAMTSFSATGNTTCADLGGAFGALVCAGPPPFPRAVAP
jgi:hypothetical protein